MIRSRRRQHRYLSVVLAVTIPTLLISILSQRRAVPPVVGLDSALATAHGTALSDANGTLIDTGAHRLRVRWQAEQNGTALLELQPLSTLLRADILVYWSPETSAGAGGALPFDSVLTGRLAGGGRRLLNLPTAAYAGRGQLVFYSLAQQQTVLRLAMQDTLAGAPEGD